MANRYAAGGKMSRVLENRLFRPIRSTSGDIDAAHQRRWPGRPVSWVSRLWLLLSSPGLRFMLMHRIAQWLYLKRKSHKEYGWLWRVVLVPLWLLRCVINMDTKSDIYYDCEIEQGVSFSDQGYIIFGAKRTGAGTVIGTRVTVGMSPADKGRPEIGRNVWIGSDCMVYGAISIGDGATLLPGTVLTKNIPPGVVMEGNPARLVLHGFDNSGLRGCPDSEVMRRLKMIRGAADV